MVTLFSENKVSIILGGTDHALEGVTYYGSKIGLNKKNINVLEVWFHSHYISEIDLQTYLFKSIVEKWERGLIYKLIRYPCHEVRPATDNDKISTQ